MLNIDKYLSVRWQMGGRVYPILDCYGLVLEVQSDLGIDVWPAFDGLGQKDIESDGAVRVREITKQCEAREGSVAACYKGGMVTHVAIVIKQDGQLMVMESNQKSNVTILSLPRFERKYPRVEYYL